MSREDIPSWLKDFLISLFINLVIGGITYLLTTNVFITIGALVATIIGVIIAYYAHNAIGALRNSGLKRTYKDSPDPTPMLKKYFENSTRVRLLAIRGARMLGTDRSLISYILSQLPKSWKGRIEILLLNPSSPYLSSRAKELGIDDRQFATECQTSIQTIAHLKKRYGCDIELRLYSRRPVLRAIIFDDRALLSYYIENEGHIPIQYEISGGANSLLRMINLLYDELWNESTTV